MNLLNFRFPKTRSINLRKLLRLNLLCFSIALTGLVFSMQVQAQPGSVVDYTAPTEIKGLLPPFTVPIPFDDHGFGIVSFQFDILYNPLIMNPTGSNFGCSTSGTLPGAGGTIVLCNVVPGDEGRLRLSSLGFATFTTGPDGSGTGPLVNLTFQATPAAVQGDMSPLTFESDFFFNNFGPIATQNPTNGQITFVGPSAANTTVSGRVVTSRGRGIRNAVTILTDLKGNMKLNTSNSFGYYRFDEVQSGETYTISVISKGYTFIPKVISVVDNITDFDLIAEP